MALFSRDRKAEKALRAEVTKRIQAQVDAEIKRELAYKQLVGTDLNYEIIQDLINRAVQDVEILVTLRDGSSLKIVRSQRAASSNVPTPFRGTF